MGETSGLTAGKVSVCDEVPGVLAFSEGEGFGVLLTIGEGLGEIRDVVP